MTKYTNIAAMCGAFLAGFAAFGTYASAETATRTYVGPNGGTVHWRGDAVPGHYRGAVTVKTPDGDVYRRVTNVHRGPNGTTISRRWRGPNGGVVRGRVRY